ncbi:MAG: SMI1/KNR4 family protein [Brasilonema octagenarum HA4186-MV1]|jgi:cell wall assembly regulator SMI1|nr:SMI1/KNR4 family protein [Brasilonema octagenarum HA4186-MV1]
MKEILNRIEIWFNEHLPKVLADLNPGATESEIESLENHIGIQLPMSFKEFYKWHNGQQGKITGLFYGLEFLSLEGIFEQWKTWSDIIDVDETINEEIGGKSHIPGKVKEIYINKKWIPFVHDWGGNHIGIDFDPAERGRVGQVINFGRDEDVKFVLADDFESFLNWLMTELESGNYIVDSEGYGSFNTMKPETQHFLDSVKLIYQSHL